MVVGLIKKATNNSKIFKDFIEDRDENKDFWYYMHRLYIHKNFLFNNLNY